MGTFILCPSVRHCGHHFMRYRIFEPYYAARPPTYRIHAGDRKSIVFMGHFESHNGFNALWGVFGLVYTAYIPLRHPARVLESFMRRATVGSDYRNFVLQWEAMMAFTKQTAKKVTYLHLDDHDIRYRQASRKLTELGIEHTIDWSVDKESGSKHGTHNLELTKELLDRVPSRFIDFYYNTMEV